MRRVVSLTFVLSVLVVSRAFGQDGRPVIVNSAGTAATASNIITTGGNVGIGTSTPAVKLDVTGQVNASGGLCIAGDCKASWSSATGGSQWTSSGTAINYATGNVGIGVASPQAKLDVAGNIVIGNNIGGQLSFGDPASFNTGLFRSSYALAADALNVQGLYRVLFNTGTFAEPTERMRVDSTGVRVTGNVTATGSIAANYQDVAEWVEADQPIAAGTVVMADPARDNGVRISAGAYETSVAGVVSAQPGVLLGVASASKVAVAQSGRVKVKVDASYGAIARGDVLVTSPREGYAMKSQPVMVGDVPMHRPGTILGKALEALPSGEGEILVLVTLH